MPERIIGRVELEYIRPPDRYYPFKADLISVDDGVMALSQEFQPGQPLSYAGMEVLAAGYWAVWFIFNGQPWDVARSYRPDGTFTGYYCDVLEPVHWQDADPATLQPIVDLFLDLWITPDGGYLVLDEDELEEAERSGWLSEGQAERARATLSELVSATGRGDFPPTVVRDFRL